MIKVSYESRNYNDEANSLAGRSVANIYDDAKQLLGLPEKSSLEVQLNGSSASFDDTVDADDELEFVSKTSGNKGN